MSRCLNFMFLHIIRHWCPHIAFYPCCSMATTPASLPIWWKEPGLNQWAMQSHHPLLGTPSSPASEQWCLWSIYWFFSTAPWRFLFLCPKGCTSQPRLPLGAATQNTTQHTGQNNTFGLEKCKTWATAPFAKFWARFSLGHTTEELWCYQTFSFEVGKHSFAFYYNYVTKTFSQTKNNSCFCFVFDF